MNLEIEGKQALVLGASTGLGNAVAKRLVDEGVKTIICSRSEKKLRDAISETGAYGYELCDLTDSSQREQVIEMIKSKYGAIDILVTNSGGPPQGEFLAITNEQWHQEFENLWMGSIAFIRAFLPGMIAKNWGRVVMITSVSAKESILNLTLSNAYRAGLLGLCNSISQEVAQANVTINSVLPGYIATQRLIDLGRDPSILKEKIPAKRIGQPSEFADLVCFLASQRASYITGQAIACDGGILKGI
ncbi:MAG: SDR family oxidoreductase [Bdellovibrionales bacterium]|nr:SDR family oxidoreductase [Bdellovibrionales bacterium]